MSDITSAGPILKDARTRAGLSQRELARRAHTTQAVVARIESGATDPSFSMLRRLLNAANLDLTVGVVERTEVDPVIEAYKKDVDQTLLIENLRRTLEQRGQTLVAMALMGAEFGRVRARRVAERKR